ncbi:MAG: hypothetical protein HUJ54_07850 [Erysipelotrichaceae bacterium]|nr:hypothetical protein [Erysipelotrichaceae bacterium]
MPLASGRLPLRKAAVDGFSVLKGNRGDEPVPEKSAFVFLENVTSMISLS